MIRKNIGWFIKGFALVAILLLVAFAIYGTQQSVAQISGNENQAESIANDAFNTEFQGIAASESVTGDDAGPNVQLGGESVVLDDNPGTVVTTSTYEESVIGNSNVAIEIMAPDAFGTEGSIQSTPYSVVIPAADFSNDGLRPTNVFFSFSEGAWNGYDTVTCMMAPAYLPHGVTIAEFWGTFNDTDATKRGEMRLYRKYNYSLAASEQMASVDSGTAYAGGYSNPGDTTIASPVVDSPNYSYFVGGCLEANTIEFVSVRIYYWP